ncbi:MAG: ATP synthase F1 subunit delta [Thermogutta sp.]|nr:ATP synthase F1 subunit delta [Thermogutta sp.]
MTADMHAEDARFAAEFSPDVTVERIAAVYAEAFLDVAQAAGEAEASVQELADVVQEVLDPWPDFEAVLASSVISHEEKSRLLRRVFEGRASEQVLNFLQVLSRRGRLDCLRAIVRAVQEEWIRRQNQIRVKVKTAVPLTAAVVSELERTLESLLGRRPIIEQRVEPDLLGGIVIEVGDTVFDASVAVQLERVRKQIIDRSAHEIQSRRDRFRDSE